MIERLTTSSCRTITIGLLIAAVGVVTGCGDGRPRRVPVSGTVVIDGAPVPHGFITFIPSEGRSASGQLDSEGRFTLTSYDPGDGTLPGPHRVTVLARESLSETKAKWHAPDKYSKPDTSGIVVDITGPTNDLKVELTWGNQKPYIETDG